MPTLAVLTWFVSSTRQGKAMRAVAQDTEASAMMGINVNRTISVTFFLAGSLAAVAGLVFFLEYQVRFDSGFQLGLIAFTAAVLGGIGNLTGAVLGALLSASSSRSTRASSGTRRGATGRARSCSGFSSRRSSSGPRDCSGSGRRRARDLDRRPRAGRTREGAASAGSSRSSSIVGLLYPLVRGHAQSLPLIGDFVPSTESMVVMVAFTMMALGLNIVVGYAGLLDLGYVAFYAVGAYTAGWFASQQFDQVTFHFLSSVPDDQPGIHVTMWLVLIARRPAHALAGVVIGLPTLRLRGDYLAIVTLGFGEIVPQVVSNGDDVGGFDLTHGTFGIAPIDSVGFPILNFTGCRRTSRLVRTGRSGSTSSRSRSS